MVPNVEGLVSETRMMFKVGTGRLNSGVKGKGPTAAVKSAGPISGGKVDVTQQGHKPGH